MALDVDLTSWRIRGTVGFAVPEGTIIRGGEYLVIGDDSPAWRERLQAGTALGPLTGRLGNGSGRLELVDRNGRLMDRLDYADDGRWPVAPTVRGYPGASADAGQRSPELDRRAGGWHSRRGNFPTNFARQQITLVPLEEPGGMMFPVCGLGPLDGGFVRRPGLVG
jgi:hypothetical protein